MCERSTVGRCCAANTPASTERERRGERGEGEGAHSHLHRNGERSLARVLSWCRLRCRLCLSCVRPGLGLASCGRVCSIAVAARRGRNVGRARGGAGAACRGCSGASRAGASMPPHLGLPVCGGFRCLQRGTLIVNLKDIELSVCMVSPAGASYIPRGVALKFSPYMITHIPIQSRNVLASCVVPPATRAVYLWMRQQKSSGPDHDFEELGLATMGINILDHTNATKKVGYFEQLEIRQSHTDDGHARRSTSSSCSGRSSLRARCRCTTPRRRHALQAPHTHDGLRPRLGMWQRRLARVHNCAQNDHDSTATRVDSTATRVDSTATRVVS